MATDPGSTKVRRKPTTYGKVMHRDGFDFDVPTSPDQSEDDVQRVASFTQRPVHTSSSSRATAASRSPRRPTAKANNVSKQIAPNVNEETLASQPADRSVDPFDVPSSEDEEAIIASPFKPAIKRRRMPGKENNGTLTPSRVENHTSPGRPINTTKSAKHGQTPPPRLNSPFMKDSKGLQSSVPVSNKSVANMTKSRPSGAQSPRIESAKRKAEEGNDLSVSRINPSTATVPVSKGRESTKTSAKISNQEPGRPARSLSRTSSRQGGDPSPNHPQTPPSEGRSHDTKKDDSQKDAPQQSAFSFMSPSGLDFHGLDISGSPANFNSRKDLLEPSSRLTTSVRTKLKDRLAKRDGAYSDSNDDSLMQLENKGANDELEIIVSAVSGHSPANSDSQEAILQPCSQPEPTSLSQLASTSEPRHTYAARNRTLRKDENETENDIFASLAEVHESPFSGTRRIRTAVQPKITEDVTKNSMDFDDLEDSQVSTLRNIHELREAGANARLTGETEAIFDEIESNSPSMRRNGLLSLLAKLGAKPFRDTFSSSSLDSRLLNNIDREMDLLSSILLAMVLLQIIAGQASSQALVQYKDRKTLDFIESLFHETESLRSVARNRKSNASKALQQEIEQACQVYLKSPLWRFGSPVKLTPRTISLQLLEYVVKYLRKVANSRDILPSSFMELLTDVLASSQDLPTGDGDFLDVRITLSILETSTLVQTSTDTDFNDPWHRRILETLADLLSPKQEWNTLESAEMLAPLVRLGLNLTNSDASACMVFSRPQVLDNITSSIEQHFHIISKDSDSNAIVDGLILSLGFLINLAENNRSARFLFAEPTGTRGSPLDILLQLFASKWVKAFEVTSEHESRESVPLGYLSVLLAFITIETTNREYVASRLEGGSLRHLLIAVDAFLSYHRKVAEDLHGVDDNAEPKAHFVNRVQVVLSQLRATEPKP